MTCLHFGHFVNLEYPVTRHRGQSAAAAGRLVDRVGDNGAVGAAVSGALTRHGRPTLPDLHPDAGEGVRPAHLGTSSLLFDYLG